MPNQYSKKAGYTQEQIQFLRDNANKYTTKQLAEMLTEKFNRPTSKSALCKAFKTHGIVKKRVTGEILNRKSTDTYHVYTAEERDWLKKHNDEMTRDELADKFNEVFGCNVSRSSVKDVCIKRLGLKRSVNKGCFAKGDGRVDNSRLPIGTERRTNGYLMVKYNDIKHDGKVTHKMFRENWMEKQRYVYEQAHGAIPDGYVVVFLDNDSTNYDIENLYCIPRKILAVMNKNNWFNKNPELTLTAIKWCELHYALKGNAQEVQP